MKGLLFLISSRQCNYPIPNQKSELNLAKYLWERDDRDYILSVGKMNEQKIEVKSELTLAKYLWERDDRDFILSVGKNNEQKTEVKIHKLILASRSPVFDRMLQTEMKEKSEGKVEIIDFDPETVKIAVEFFYDREIDECLNVGLLIDLLQFAEKYDVQDLKGKTEIILCKKLRPHNICQISNGSVISNATMLKDACIQTMLFYMNKKIPFDEAITLNKNFSAEVIHAGSLLVENRLQ
uniref:BTB domain-containing protein n=1 Tax=Panagrolaimus sp. PS1159 TaxID=55785 RepID=A0AC35GBX9_9BILA